jgi:hypothetical protein
VFAINARDHPRLRVRARVSFAHRCTHAGDERVCSSADATHVRAHNNVTRPTMLSLLQPSTHSHAQGGAEEPVQRCTYRPSSPCSPHALSRTSLSRAHTLNCMTHTRRSLPLSTGGLSHTNTIRRDDPRAEAARGCRVPGQAAAALPTPDLAGSAHAR